MAKTFREVFPTLKVKEDVMYLFQETSVEQVSVSKDRRCLKVRLSSDHLISDDATVAMTKEMKRQLFASMPIELLIEKHYTLSGQYTPENLFDLIRDDMISELRRMERGIFLSGLLKSAIPVFKEKGEVVLSLEKGFIADQDTYRKMLKSYVESVYTHRCNMPCKVTFDFHESTAPDYRKMGEERVQRLVEKITERNSTLREQNVAEEAEKETKETKKKEYVSVKRSDDPSMIFGRYFDDPVTELKEVVQEMGEITFRGQIVSFETREIRNEKTILFFSVTDYTDTIMVKMFVKNASLPELLPDLKEGKFIKVKGITTIDKYDNELSVGSVTGIKRIPSFLSQRDDNAPKKRVELHCHTKMSDMDGVSEAKDLVKRAHDWGHKAIALTDHGVVQAFTEAHHYIESLPPDDPFKVIYGVEGYLVDDLQKIVTNPHEETLKDAYVVFDLETTGFSNIKDKIIEIGAVRIENGIVTDRFSEFVNPERPIPYKITTLTGISDGDVKEASVIEEVLPRFLEFIEGATLVAHNAGFDVGFIEQNCRYQDIIPDFTYLDTVSLARVLLPTLNRYKLDTVAKEVGVSLENHHRAVDDAEATAGIFLRFADRLRQMDITMLKDVNRLSNLKPEAIKKLPTYHVILIALNDEGRVNLYKLVSESHLTYFSRRPRIPKSLLNRYRKGLLVGSACEAGELYQALLRNKNAEAVAGIVDFYDFLEIQPLGNNAFMVDSDKVGAVTSFEDIKAFNKEIVSLGEKFGKPVVGTCDVHFMDPGDEVYRRIIMAGKGFKDADNQPPLYLRTTEEMLEEFSYLGKEKAEEIVITNPNRIADCVEKIAPVRPDKCPPVIPNSDEMLRTICYNKAHSMYGDDLPEIVTERLERELNSIISNGFAVMYIIAQKLVWKSNDDGYLVGSRGSVGSSFVATMAGITEVNPLRPHYYCEHCHYSDFDSEEVLSYQGGCGHDMPDKNCPVCGEKLVKDGFDIPFETFLGFKGNKEPDIDLNFSGDYQSNAHKYTEVIFGDGQTYRAGTIGTLADKTAYGYVKNYFEERQDRKRTCEINRIVKGCTGIRRSTGQHPGGIIVLPLGEEINSFTPVQHPANDMKTDIVTTHFDYHSIDHNLLKLDILGHDDPTIIKMLEEIITDQTGKTFNAQEIPLDDPGVMSLFAGTDALGIKPQDIGGCPVGCLGIPEFGTDFVIQMVCDTKPKSLSDLIRISGLSHGTDVWLGNAQTLIEEGKATISTAICTRDDIMTYLIGKGMDSELSFTIMEKVRKGKGLTPEHEQAMIDAGVPDWYIWSCKKIKYMFPKAHAAAYVMMAYRIAYCKVNYPLAYYAAFFSIRASAFSYELMCQGREALEEHMRDYEKRMDTLSPKEQGSYKDMKIVREMYARGFTFMPIDIYRAKANKFQVIDGKLMPSLSSLDGMGDKAAEAVELAAAGGKYLSKDDFRSRTHVSKTVVDLMDKLNLLGNLPESNQLSIFDI